MADPLSRFPQRAPREPRRPARPSIEDIVFRDNSERANANLIDDAVAPGDARRSMVLGRDLGYDPAGVSADVRSFEFEASVRDATDKLANDLPLTNWLKDPLRASASKDDLPALSAISSIFNGTSTKSLPLGTAEQNNDPLGKRFMERMREST